MKKWGLEFNRSRLTFDQQPENCWKVCGLSGAVYRLLKLVFRHPASHPRVLEALFGNLALGGVLVKHLPTGAKLLLDPSDYIADEILSKGAYEPKTHSLALEILSTGGGFLDVGSNVGLYTLPAAMLPNVKVVAVDGSVPALSRLWTNSQLSNVRPAIVAALIGRDSGIAEIRLPCKTNLGGAQLTDSKDTTYVNHASFSSLDDLLSVSRHEPLRLLKVDIEGQEWELIRRLPMDEASCPQNIIVELFLSNPNSAQIYNYLVSNKYVARSVCGETLTELRETHESNVWFQRLSKGSFDASAS